MFVGYASVGGVVGRFVVVVDVESRLDYYVVVVVFVFVVFICSRRE